MLHPLLRARRSLGSNVPFVSVVLLEAWKTEEGNYKVVGRRVAAVGISWRRNLWWQISKQGKSV